MSMLEVVNDADEIIGIKPRAEIHAQGLRHREVHVWLVTPEGQVVFQRRSPTKESFPNMLDATAGGHVEIGQSYLESALMELEEETGIVVQPDDLIEILKLNKSQVLGDPTFKNIVFRMIYMLPWKGQIADLKIEAEDGSGFVLVPLKELLSKSPESADDMIPELFTENYMPVWEKIDAILCAA